MKNAYVYIRDENEKDGIRKYCDENQYRIRRIIKGYPSIQSHHRQLWKTIQIAKPGSVLLAVDASHLAQDPYVYACIKYIVNARQCKIVTINWDVPWDQNSGIVMEQSFLDIYFYFNSFKRTRKYWAEGLEIQEKKKCGRYPKYGYQIDPENPKNLVEDATEQAVLRQIYSMEKMKACSIAKRLNGMRVPCRGKKWHTLTVSRIMKRKAIKNLSDMDNF